MEIKFNKPNFGAIVGIVVVIFIIGFAATVFFNSYFTVSEQENVVVLSAGKYSDTKEAGLHFKMPFFQSARSVNMTTQGMEMGYLESGGVAVTTEESMMITYDFNIVSVDLYVEWRVTNPVKYLYNVSEPNLVLRNVVQSSARDIVSSYGVDSVLTDGKSEIQTKMRQLINEVLYRYDIGIEVTNVTIQDAEPPNESVKLAFKAVEDAKQKKDTLINEATKYYNENIPGARAEADRLVKSAEGVKEARIFEADGQVARFNEIYSEYINNPDITKARMYYEAIEEILPSLKVIIDSSESGTLKMFSINE